MSNKTETTAQPQLNDVTDRIYIVYPIRYATTAVYITSDIRPTKHNPNNSVS